MPRTWVLLAATAELAQRQPHHVLHPVLELLATVELHRVHRHHHVLGLLATVVPVQAVIDFCRLLQQYGLAPTSREVPTFPRRRIRQ